MYNVMSSSSPNSSSISCLTIVFEPPAKPHPIKSGTPTVLMSFNTIQVWSL